jgi:hypothetical protein
MRTVTRGARPLRLYHELELWGWFATIDDREHLGAIEDAIRESIA